LLSVSTIGFLSKSRDFHALLSRVLSVLGRFSIDSGKFACRLERYCAAASALGCVPTFAVTTSIMKRHSGLVKQLCGKGAELAVHGYSHIDYGVLCGEDQTKDFKKAVDTFKGCEIPFSGFRAPFLRVNSETTDALRSAGFLYDSSHAIAWPVLNRAKYSRHSWRAYQMLLEFYQAQMADDFLALPRSTRGLIEIPVSIPDDEALVERLGIRDQKEISTVWKAILRSTYERGELFTLSLHPERFLLCEAALAETVQDARRFSPRVWIATLKEIAEWWKEKQEFAFEIEPEPGERYRLHARCSDLATILVKNCRVDAPSSAWSNGYQVVRAKDFAVVSRVPPVIGVGIDSAPAAVDFLRSEGFVVQRSERHDQCAVYLNNLSHFSSADERQLCEEIERAKAPLLRFWRWPVNARSALTVTGDIDSMTLVDFAVRLLESWRSEKGNGRATQLRSADGEN
jgi:peptidoglycan/xylan/chitin deacetylase (PgdA/CDA1 family)